MSTNPNPAQLAADALEWVASGIDDPPLSIAALPADERAQLRQAADEVAETIRDRLREAGYE